MDFRHSEIALHRDKQALSDWIMMRWRRGAEMSVPSEMACKELVELVTEYLEGTLSRTDRQRFEDHLKDCSYCATYLEQMRQTIRTLGRLTEEDLSEDAKQDLLRIFQDWKKEPRTGQNGCA